MSRPKERDLLTQISQLKSELELSAFLNKGVLQTNSEYKLRIVELERENAVLRVAESRLARTEDRLEAAEEKVREGEARAREESRRMVEEVEEGRVREERMREMLGRANRSLEGIRGMAEPVQGDAGPSVLVKKKLSLVTKRAEEKHSSATKRHERALSPLPSYIRPPSFTKKRRRVHESPPAPERYEKVETPSASPKLRPGPPSPPRSSVVQLSSGKGRNGSRAFGSATKREPRHFDDEGFEIKIEDEASNGPPPMLVDGDDDPLAMF